MAALVHVCFPSWQNPQIAAAKLGLSLETGKASVVAVAANTDGWAMKPWCGGGGHNHPCFNRFISLGRPVVQVVEFKVRAWAGAVGGEAPEPGALVSAADALTQNGRPAYTLSRPESRQGSGPPCAAMSGSTARATQRVNSCAAWRATSDPPVPLGQCMPPRLDISKEGLQSQLQGCR